MLKLKHADIISYWCTYVYHYAPLCIYVYHCVPMCTIVHHCVFMCTIVYLCVPLCIYVYHCVFMCTIVYLCVPLCIYVYHCVFMCTIVYLCVLLCIYVYHCVPLCIYVYHCVPLCIYVYHCGLNMSTRSIVWRRNAQKVSTLMFHLRFSYGTVSLPCDRKYNERTPEEACTVKITLIFFFNRCGLHRGLLWIPIRNSYSTLFPILMCLIILPSNPRRT